MSEYPDIEWFRDAENWTRWSGLLGMRFSACCSKKVYHGGDPATVVNEVIFQFAKEMNDQKIPDEIIMAFLRQYLDMRPQLMKDANDTASMQKELRAKSKAKKKAAKDDDDIPML